MYVVRKDNGWSSAKNVGKSVNSVFNHWQVSVNRNYDLYFHAEDKVEQPGIYVSRYVNGKYQASERLPKEINTGRSSMPYIAPDDSYLVFARTTREDRSDLFVSFKDSNGQWTDAISLGKSVNSRSNDICPNVTPDGKYLFFLSQRDGRSKAYWVSAEVIDELRPRE
jgi:Tol biopolymer transport system component